MWDRGGAVELPVEIEFRQPFAASDQTAWEAEYLAKIRPIPDFFSTYEQESLWR